MIKNPNNIFNILTNTIDYLSEKRISFFEKFIVVGFLLAYILSPLDIIPDFIPVFGWLDDIGISCLMLAFFSYRLKKIESTAIDKNDKSKFDDANVIDVTPVEKQSFQLPDNSDKKMPKDFFTIKDK